METIGFQTLQLTEHVSRSEVGMNLVQGPLRWGRFQTWLSSLKQAGSDLLSRIFSRMRRFGRKPRLIYGGWETNRFQEANRSGVG